MKLNEDYIRNSLKDGKFDREVAFELMKSMGYTDETIETRLDLWSDEYHGVEEAINSIINEEYNRKISILHSSAIDENDVKGLLLRFSRKLLENVK